MIHFRLQNREGNRLSHQIMLLSFFNCYIIIEVEEMAKKNFVTAVQAQMRENIGGVL